MLSTLVYSTKGNNGPDNIVLRHNGSRIEVYDAIAAKVVAQSKPSTDAVEINGAPGESDTLTIDYGFVGGFFTLAGGIRFNGGAGAGTDRLVVKGNGAIAGTYRPDGNISGSGMVTVTSPAASGTITFTGLEPVTVSNMTAVTLVTPNAKDGLTLDSPAVGQTRISGTSGGVLLESLTLFDIPALTVDAAANDGAGADDMIVIATGGLAANHLEQVHLLGGLGDDGYTIDPRGEVTITETGGHDTVDFSTSSEGITVTLSDGSGTASDSDGHVILNGEIEKVCGTPFDDTMTARIESATKTLCGGDGNDTLIDESHADFTYFEGGAGDDTFVLDPGSTVVVTDDGGTDTLNFFRTRSGGVGSLGGFMAAGGSYVGSSNSDLQVRVALLNTSALGEVLVGGFLVGQFLGVGTFENVVGTPAGLNTITGNSSNNTFFVTPGGDYVISDPGGIDTIDFSLATSGITFDLSRNDGRFQTVDVAGHRVAISGVIENLTGSEFDDIFTGNSENNIILGLGGDDQLVGASGFDLLIGGRGADRIVGSGGEDILIAGFTRYDDQGDVDYLALLAILDEWTSGRRYATRVANLEAHLLRVGATVFDDGNADMLTGSQSQDWFFIGVGDRITDSVRDEFINYG